MIDIKFLREEPELVEKKIRSKGIEIDIRKILKLDEDHRTLNKRYEDFLALKNKASEKIAGAAGKEKTRLIDEMKSSDRDSDRLAAEIRGLEEQLVALLYQIPNLPKDDVKVGKDENDNEELRRVGEPQQLDFKARDHVALGELLNIVDTKRAARTSGTRFGYLKNGGALLELALINYALDILLEHGFQFVVPPTLIKKEAMHAMGYLEHGGEQEIYHLPKDELYLVGTSEQSIGPMHLDEVLKETGLPLRYVGFSSCFRREAGAYGKDTRGILRVHQFDKVEMFSFTTPEQSDAEQEFFLALEEKLMQGLGIPYRVLKMCTGDLGPQAARKYDIEAWIPSENRYRETHSTSNCTDFQARRLKTRYKTKAGKNEYVHTVNGTAFAIGRTLIALLENFQNYDGSVDIPLALQPYMRGITKLEPES